MHTDARDGGLRPKRCLPAKLHSRLPTPTYQETASTRFLCRLTSKVPQVADDNSTAPKRANSRFFTDCYPISARFAPAVDQIRRWKSWTSTKPSNLQIND